MHRRRRVSPRRCTRYLEELEEVSTKSAKSSPLSYSSKQNMLPSIFPLRIALHTRRLSTCGRMFDSEVCTRMWWRSIVLRDMLLFVGTLVAFWKRGACSAPTETPSVCTLVATTYFSRAWAHKTRENLKETLFVSRSTLTCSVRLI